LVEALRVSCNVFFYQEGLTLGVERIAAEARRFGLDKPTGIELPGEARRMIVPDREWKRRTQDDAWFPGDTANLAIGQGFLRVTPLQMCDFIAALARGETRTNPTILSLRSAQRPPADPSSTAEATPIGLSNGALALVKDGMELAVQRGTGRLARIDGLRVAGKTGTAQVEAPGGTLNMAWFVGFAPVESPEIAVTVIIEGRELDVEFAGGREAAPAAKAIFERYFDKKPAAE
jgi:penicillin-binding protein 2